MSGETQTTALAILPRALLPVILAADDKDIFGSLYAELKDFKADISTKKGRDEIASKARKVAVAKMDLVRLGDALKEDALKTQRSIVAEQNMIRTKMDQLRDEVRKPLDEFEAAEESRVKEHEDMLAAITEPEGYGMSETAVELTARLAFLHAFPSRDWQEFTHRAGAALKLEIERTQILLAAAIKREEDARELDRLRAEALERKIAEEIETRRIREEKIASEAAETARLAAEEKAANQAREAERLAQAERDASIERERIAAKKLAEAIEQAAAMETERLRREEALAAQAEKDREAAILAERRRQVDLETARKAEDDRRAADKAHRGRINREALSDMVGIGLNEPAAKEILEAIIRGQIRHIGVSY